MLAASGTDLASGMWCDFVRSTPQALRVRELLVARGELVHHDHVALRTLAAPGLGMDAIARRFEAEGFRARERYRFDEAHLRARYWQHDDPNTPKVFIVELDACALSAGAQAILERLIAQVPDGFYARSDLPWAGRPWTPRYADYQSLLAESEHAARVAALGLGVDRCSLDVGALITFPDLDALVAYLAEHAFRIDARSDRATIRPDSIPVAFADTMARIPSGTYELVARRLPRPRESRSSGIHAVIPSASRSSR
ncbi:MAG TPA: hypothetical protein VNO30_28690 [Kofleriaceae bacterium]|nr:hypothetical protein [Kofleriaceae bacterium]